MTRTVEHRFCGGISLGMGVEAVDSILGSQTEAPFRRGRSADFTHVYDGCFVTFGSDGLSTCIEVFDIPDVFFKSVQLLGRHRNDVIRDLKAIGIEVEIEDDVSAVFKDCPFSLYIENDLVEAVTIEDE